MAGICPSYLYLQGTWEKFGLEREWDQIFMETQVSIWLLSNSINAPPLKAGALSSQPWPPKALTKHLLNGQLLPANPVSSKLEINH